MTKISQMGLGLAALKSIGVSFVALAFLGCDGPQPGEIATNLVGDSSPTSSPVADVENASGPILVVPPAEASTKPSPSKPDTESSIPNVDDVTQADPLISQSQSSSPPVHSATPAPSQSQYPIPQVSPEPAPNSCVPRAYPAAKYDIDVSTSTQAICASHPACGFLQTKYALGQASGNVGDIYQNVDNNHARPNLDWFPQVTSLQSQALGQFGPLLNLPAWEHRGKATIANGSYGITVSNVTYSIPRYYLHRPAMIGNPLPLISLGWGIELATNWFEENIHIWHVGHTDHDSTRNKFYTTYPAVGVSQGSSGSEIDEVQHQFAILAGFRPDVKKWLRDRGLLIETMLMAHRWGRGGSNSGYLQGSAHPAAMNDISSEAAIKMVEKANEITLDRLPPFARLTVMNQTFSTTGDSEKIADLPYLVSRLFKQNVAEHSIEINAESSFDPNCLPLTYNWVVLAGEFDGQNNRKVTVEQIEPGSWKKVRIKFRPHEFVAPGTTSTMSKLMYVGLFVSNGYFYSLPALVTVSADPSAVP